MSADPSSLRQPKFCFAKFGLAPLLGMTKRNQYKISGKKYMALYYYLPVYKASYDLLLAIFQLTKNFSREYKYTIGQDLKKIATEMILNIYRANSVYDKKDIIQNARENLEVIRLIVRLLKDLRQINIEKTVFLNELIESVSKQLAGWQESKKKAA